jgi:hypothetical protein
LRRPGESDLRIVDRDGGETGEFPGGDENARRAARFRLLPETIFRVGQVSGPRRLELGQIVHRDVGRPVQAATEISSDLFYRALHRFLRMRFSTRSPTANPYSIEAGTEIPSR